MGNGDACLASPWSTEICLKHVPPFTHHKKKGGGWRETSPLKSPVTILLDFTPITSLSTAAFGIEFVRHDLENLAQDGCDSSRCLSENKRVGSRHAGAFFSVSWRRF